MKYIMFESPNLGIFPVLFPNHIKHDFIAASVHSSFPGTKATSAGFVHVEPSETQPIRTVGDSMSLHLKSASEDAYWIRKMFKE